MLGFKIIGPGLFSTFQDKGRLGFQNEGMPISGAMDLESMIIANRLVGKDDDAVLEMTFTGAEITFEKPMSISITGADMQPCINEKPVTMYETLPVKTNDRLSFKGLISGFRTYVGFSDELILDEVFGSKSTYVKINAGGFKGRKLEKNDEIHVKDRPFSEIFKTAKPHHEDVVRVLLGYESDEFIEPKKLFKKPYDVTNELDRMGVRLTGETLNHKSGADIISSPIVPGAIQVPKSGQPMVMLRDAQTTGGYTRVGTVITCDLDRLAQKKPGDKIQFEEVTLDEAIQAKKEWLNRLNGMNLKDERRHFSVTVNGQNYDVLVEEIE